MNTKSMLGAVLGTVLKVILAVVVIVLVYRVAISAYDFGYKIFDETAISEAPGREVTVSITSGKGAKEIGQILEDKGLIKDAKIFYIQNMLSSYKGKLKPGSYTLNTAMSSEEIMAAMSPEEIASDDENQAD